MPGVIVNTATILVGSGIGLIAKKALCVMYIGITGSLEGENTLIIIISVAVGAVIGAAFDLDRHLNHFAAKLENRFKKEGEKSTVAEGFISASLLFCVGAMTIVGSL